MRFCTFTSRARRDPGVSCLAKSRVFKVEPMPRFPARWRTVGKQRSPIRIGVLIVAAPACVDMLEQAATHRVCVAGSPSWGRRLSPRVPRRPGLSLKLVRRTSTRLVIVPMAPWACETARRTDPGLASVFACLRQTVVRAVGSAAERVLRARVRSLPRSGRVVSVRHPRAALRPLAA